MNHSPSPENPPFFRSLTALGGSASQVSASETASPSPAPQSSIPPPPSNGASPFASSSAPSSQTLSPSLLIRRGGSAVVSDSSHAPPEPLHPSTKVHPQSEMVSSGGLLAGPSTSEQNVVDQLPACDQRSNPPTISPIRGKHTLADKSVFDLSEGKVYRGRSYVEDNIRRIALQHKFQVIIKTSPRLKGRSCPATATYKLRCRHNAAPDAPDCPFFVKLRYTLLEEGKLDDSIDYKIVWIHDVHNHGPFPKEDLTETVKPRPARQVYLSGNHPDRRKKESRSDTSEDEESVRERIPEPPRRRPIRRAPLPQAGTTAQDPSSFTPKDLATWDWSPTTDYSQRFTSDEILKKFPEAVCQETGFAVSLDRRSVVDIVFRCQHRISFGCEWKAVFTPMPSIVDGETELCYQLLPAGKHRSCFSHSHGRIDLPTQSVPPATDEVLSRSDNRISSPSQGPSGGANPLVEPLPTNASIKTEQTVAEVPSGSSRPHAFERSSSPDNLEASRPDSKKRARSSAEPEMPLAQATPINLGTIILDDTDEEAEEEVKPLIANRVEKAEVRQHKHARIAAPEQSNEQSRTDARQSLPPAPAQATASLTPTGTPLAQVDRFSSPSPAQKQEQLAHFLLSIDPEFDVFASNPSKKLKLDFLAPLFLSHDRLPDYPDNIRCYQPDDADDLVPRLEEAYIARGQELGSINGFDWDRIKKRFKVWLSTK